MSAALPPVLQELIRSLQKLPGIGPRSAERIAIFIAQGDEACARSLAELLTATRDRVRLCTVCGAFTEQQPCAICSSPMRDGTLLCVVDQPTDILAIEKSSAFRGKYHVLGGCISPLLGIGPEDLRVAELEERVAQPEVQEVILALGTDVLGDATSYYLARRLGAHGKRVTRLAHGLPVGTGLAYADELTLGQALEGRREIT